jgi:uncharacterized repeat protein (TIGR01451 family)
LFLETGGQAWRRAAPLAGRADARVSGRISAPGNWRLLPALTRAFALCAVAALLLGAATGTARSDVANTVTANGTPRGGTLGAAQANEAVDLQNRAPAIGVSKTANVGSVNAAGNVIVYSVAVQNTGNTTLSAITVSDTLVTLVCPTSGNATIATLAPGASETCTGSYTVTQTDLDGNGGGDGDIDNTASASGSGASGSGIVSGTGAAAVLVVVNPSLAIAKSYAITADGGTIGAADLGDVITYTYAVTNNGNVTIANAAVNDAHGGSGPLSAIAGETLTGDVAPLGDSTDAVANNAVWSSIRPGDTVTFTATYTVTQTDVDNQ